VAKDILVGKGGSEQKLSKEEWAIMSWTRRLVEACKMWLLPLDLEDEQDKSHVWRLIDEVAEHYGVFVDESLKDRTYTLTCQTIEGCKDFAERGEIDFVDMLWLPVILGMPIKKADLVLVDEGQDLNPVQQCLVQRSGGRIIMAGDDKQAINGFAGADVNGMDTMRKELGRSRGCEEFPLTVTMRCPKRVVREVKHLVPDFEAHEDNPEGHILESFQHLGRGGRPFAESYLSRLVPGDLVVCRTSGMLVRDCLTMIRQGHPSCIIGKSIGEELVNLINSLKANSVDQLRQKIHAWASEIFMKESAKENPNTQRMTDAENTADMILFFTDLGQAENPSVDWIKFLIRSVFTDDQTEGKIKFATIHKAKGLEATNVFFHVGRGCEIPHKKARLPWEIEQEYNLMYVAMTRSLGTLTYVR
jgi:superfamily I DNA/RNA helicase